MPIFTAIGTTILGSLGFIVCTNAAVGVFSIVTATTAMIVGIGTTALIFGGIALSITSANKKTSFGDLSSTYGSGILQTQTNQDLPIPLLYGTCKLAGNRIWQDENNTTTVKRIVAFAEGEISEFTEIKLNDIDIKDISGIKVNKYYGTRDQVVDEIVGGDNQEERAEKVGSLRDVAYLAITVSKSQKIDINYNLTAVIKGRKVRVYKTSKSFEVKYSENPAWVMFDFLTCYNGLGLGINNYGNIDDKAIEKLFDLESFIESAEFCDELIETKKKNEDGEEIIIKKPRFTFNMIFDAQTSARSLIDEVFRSCRGGLFIKDGKLQFKIDKPEPVSKYIAGDAIVRGSETFQTIPKEEHYDILKCVYVSPKHEWQKLEAFAEIPEYRDGVPIEHSVNIYSVTDFEQASRLAWYYVNSKSLQPYFGSFQTDYRAFDLEVGDVITFDSLLMGLEKYKVKVISVIDDGAGTFTVNWRNYDERLYSDELGSQEPRVLVSNLTDIAAYPADVKNFNVVQQQNLFNFIWALNESSTDTYEIRVGESWGNGAVVAKNLTQNKFSYEIPTSGVFKFWIKAFNRYNHSKTPTLDVVSIDSVPMVNEVVKFDILKEMSGVFENTRCYQNTIKLCGKDVLWQTSENAWGIDDYYRNTNLWGADVLNQGTYTSQVYDIGAILECIVAPTTNYTSEDESYDITVTWRYSDDSENWTPWTIANTGQYKLRYAQFKAEFKAYNNVQLILNKFEVSIDVPDKELVLDVEITDAENGLLVEYDFINVPSIIATVNDDITAYVVVEGSSKTNKFAVIKAYSNEGIPVCAKVNMRIKGY